MNKIIIVLLFCIFSCFMLNSDAKQKKSIESLCIISIKDKICWRNKENREGFRLRDMNGWFAISPKELAKILSKIK